PSSACKASSTIPRIGRSGWFAGTRSSNDPYPNSSCCVWSSPRIRKRRSQWLFGYFSGELCRGRDAGFPDAPRTDPYVQNCCIRLLPWMNGVEAHIRMRMQDLGTRNPSIDQRPEPLPSHLVSLTPPPKRTVPAPNHLGPKGVQTIHVAGDCMIVEVALDD